MGRNLIEGIVSIVVAILGIALVAVIVGKAAQTGAVLKDAGGALSKVLDSATLAAR